MSITAVPNEILLVLAATIAKHPVDLIQFDIQLEDSIRTLSI
jgi:hypothetical protein